MWRPAAAVWEPCTAHAQLHVLTANGCEQQQQMERKVKILSMQKSPNGECIYLNRPSGTYTTCDASPLHAQPSETCVCIRIGIHMIMAGWRCRPPATELLLRKQSLIAHVIQVQEQYIEKRQSDFYKFKCEQHGAAFRGVRCSLYRFRFHSIYINKQNARAHTHSTSTIRWLPSRTKCYSVTNDHFRRAIIVQLEQLRVECVPHSFIRSIPTNRAMLFWRVLAASNEF